MKNKGLARKRYKDLQIKANFLQTNGKMHGQNAVITKYFMKKFPTIPSDEAITDDKFIDGTELDRYFIPVPVVLKDFRIENNYTKLEIDEYYRDSDGNNLPDIDKRRTTYLVEIDILAYLKETIEKYKEELNNLNNLGRELENNELNRKGELEEIREQSNGIVKFYGLRNGRIVMEDLSASGYITFEKFIEKNKELPEDSIKKIEERLRKTAKFLHDNCIAHGDIGVENVMVKRVGNEFLVKFIDFGSATKESSVENACRKDKERLENLINNELKAKVKESKSLNTPAK